MKTILIVDDDQPIRAEMVKGLDRDEGLYRLLEAQNGRQAMEILDHESIDLLVTDLDMPVMDGFELLAFMLQQHTSVPIIIMSSFGVSAMDDELEKLGAICYIEKPFDTGTIAGQIRQALALLAKGQVSGISTLGFLQLLHFEKKSCSLTVRCGERTGRIFLSGGELIDAACDRRQGEAAVLEILSWDDCEIMLSVPRHFRRAIHRPLQGLLLEAARLFDEENRNTDFEHLIGATALGGSADDPETPPEEPARATYEDAYAPGWAGLQELFKAPLQLSGVVGLAIVGLRQAEVLAARYEARLNGFVAQAKTYARLVQVSLERGKEDPLREILLTRDAYREMWVLLDPKRQIALYLLLDRQLSGLREVRREVGLIMPGLIARIEGRNGVLPTLEARPEPSTYDEAELQLRAAIGQARERTALAPVLASSPGE